MEYQPRVLDSLLREMVEGLPAVSVEGAKGVGKTATARRLARSIVEFDRAGQQSNLEADPEIITKFEPPALLDEWQLVPAVWDVVRRQVDHNNRPGRFILTGSATPTQDARIHSGAGRIVRLLMRPITLPERGLTKPSVSLAELLAGGRPQISGQTTLGLAEYTHQIVASGLPGIRGYSPRLRTRHLNSYIANALEHDIPDLGVGVRHPRSLHSWLAAYAAATATTTNYGVILDAATPGQANKISRPTATAYRELLQRIWLLDPLPAWIPAFNPLKRLAQSPKHHLVDPALAARLLGATETSLLDGTTDGPIPHDGTLLGALFESLATLTVRVFAEPHDAAVSHLRTRNGDHEIDLIVERDDHKVLAIEVKLASSVSHQDVKHLTWLESKIGNTLIDKIIINTGRFAHRLPDGTAIIPLALLGA
jgi:predicted AAA+ superfamily ATPase